ncbi:hypothetical protein U1Q18_016108 [Sarracenia purpurea var. burkii]
MGTRVHKGCNLDMSKAIVARQVVHTPCMIILMIIMTFPTATTATISSSSQPFFPMSPPPATFHLHHLNHRPSHNRVRPHEVAEDGNLLAARITRQKEEEEEDQSRAAAKIGEEDYGPWNPPPNSGGNAPAPIPHAKVS